MSRAKSYYETDFLEKQLDYYAGLPEKQRRHFLAMAYERSGVGSKRYLTRFFKCHHHTIKKGLQDLSEGNYQGDHTRQRVMGGG